MITTPKIGMRVQLMCSLSEFNTNLNNLELTIGDLGTVVYTIGYPVSEVSFVGSLIGIRWDKKTTKSHSGIINDLERHCWEVPISAIDYFDSVVDDRDLPRRIRKRR